jgi:hypothetical protein
MRHPISWSAARYAGLIFFALFISGIAPAQRLISAKGGIVQHIEGAILLDDKPVHLAKGGYIQMRNGQTLAAKLGRAELVLNPSAFLRIGENSSLKIEQNRLDDLDVTLLQGFAMVEIVEEVKGSRIVLHLSGGWAEMKKAGLYRFKAESSEIQIWGGELLASNGDQMTIIKGRREIRLGSGMNSQRFKADFLDKFHQWAGLRSFALYDTPEVLQNQPHWQPTNRPGWVRNANYRMSCFSSNLYAAQMKNLSIQKNTEEWAKRLENDQKRKDLDELFASAQRRLAEEAAAAQARREAEQNKGAPPPK